MIILAVIFLAFAIEMTFSKVVDELAGIRAELRAARTAK